MLVDGCQTPVVGSSRTPSILDSPTLARVERARLRNETNNGGMRNSSASNYIYAQVSVYHVCMGYGLMNIFFKSIFSSLIHFKLLYKNEQQFSNHIFFLR